MLEIKNVTKTYSGKKALEDVSLTIPQGEIIGLFGENGAGKTTLMKSVFGFIPSRVGSRWMENPSPRPTLQGLLLLPVSIPFSRISLQRDTRSSIRSISPSSL